MTALDQTANQPAEHDHSQQPPGQPQPPDPGPGGPAPAAGGQQRAHRVLSDLLDTADAQDLPPIDWTIAASGTRLTGRCTAYTSPGRRRADFEAWRTLLDAHTTHGTVDGQTPRLTARTERDDGQVTIEIIADLYDDLIVPLTAPTPTSPGVPLGRHAQAQGPERAL